MMDSETKIIHICEVCDKQEVLTPEEGFNSGWDYPPQMGAFGVVSPRTCGNCTVNDTLWWALMFDKVSPDELDGRKKATMERILEEPESIFAG